MENVKKGDLGMIALGIVLFFLGALVLAVEPAWIVSIAGAGAAFIAAGMTLLITTVVRVKKRDSDEVLEDERGYMIRVKAGFKAFQVSFILQGLALAVTGLALPKAFAYPVVGALFAVTGVTYVAAYNHYNSRM